MRDSNKGVIFGAVLALVLVFGTLYATGNLGEVKPTGVAEQVQKVSACPDTDGRVDLGLQYEDQESDNSGTLVTDVYMFENGNRIWTATDITDGGGVGAAWNITVNKLSCTGGPYEIWLGDETEEYFRKATVSEITTDPVYVSVKGAAIGDVKYTLKEDGVTESPLNISLGTGASTSNAEVKFECNVSDKALEALDGFVVVFGYNDTAWKEVSVVGATKISCPPGASKLVSQDDTVDGTTVCYRVSETYIADFGSFIKTLYIEAESDVDPTGASGYVIDGTLMDENRFWNSETGTLDYGYTDENENDIGDAPGTFEIHFT